jgi:D-sedoheptulose 7-phosphate isomerase
MRYNQYFYAFKNEFEKLTMTDTKKGLFLEENITAIISEHRDVVDSLLKVNMKGIKQLCETTLEKLTKGGKILFMGNGGSAADSQHLAAEFIGRFVKERRPLPAIAFTTDTSILTAVGNDYGYDQVFERQVSALCNANDILIGISTSGNSKNIIKAVEAAKGKNVCTVGLLGGAGGKLAEMVDIAIVIDSKTTARIQEAHILIGHILCEFCDEHFAANS